MPVPPIHIIPMNDKSQMLQLQPVIIEPVRRCFAFHFTPQKRRGQSVFGVTKCALILLPVTIGRDVARYRNIDADESDYAIIATLNTVRLAFSWIPRCPGRARAMHARCTRDARAAERKENE